MSDDPEIRIFGKKIAVQEGGEGGCDGMRLCLDADPVGDSCGCKKDTNGMLMHREAKDSCPSNPQIIDDVEVTSCLSNNMQMPQSEEKQTLDLNAAQKQADVGVSGQERVLKKPDKILPCPRCNSMDTKFCYFNNYNVNQPRHFCKSCQRYWTAGGSMRNVPVGAGRRKSKHSTSNHRQLMVSSCLAPATVGDVPDPACKQMLSPGVPSVMFLKGNETGRLGKDAHFSESVGKTTTPEEQKNKGDTSSKDHADNGEDTKCTTINASNCMEDIISEQESEVVPNVSVPPSNGPTPLHPLQCYPCPSWSYPWNPGWNNFSAMAAAGSRCGFEIVHGQENGGLHPFPWGPPPMVAAPAFCATTLPLPFIPASFWGCMPSWPNGTWGMPWVGSTGSPTTAVSTGGSGNNSPLGKHFRDLTTGMDDKREKSVWVPKTLRIDDPDEAAKSSIWATLGIKPGKNEQSANGGIFKGFQPQSGECNQQSDATHVLHANPAAFCRSQTFQETS